MKAYTIKKDKHSSGWFNVGLTMKDTITFDCFFEPSCLYTLDTVDKYDINKLYGFSTSWNHHIQSARVGWRCLDGQTIELLTYSYNKGVRTIGSEEILGVVRPNQKFRCSIKDIETEYVYTFHCADTGEYKEIRNPKQSDKVWFKYTLDFYFGGNLTAMHDMTAWIERV